MQINTTSEWRPLMYTFKESFHLIVRDAPGRPQPSELSEVSEGTSVNVTCTAAAPCPSQPPTITWSLPTGNTHTHIQHKKNGKRSLLSLLNFTASRSHHKRGIYCMASYPRQNGGTVKVNSVVQILTVFFSPVEVVVSVSPPGPPAEGSSVTLTCNSSECNPPVQNYTWFRGGQQGQHTPIGSGQTLTFNLSSSDEGLYYCRAEHPQGGKDSAAVRLVNKGFLAGITIKCLAAFLLTVLVIGFQRWKKSHQEIEPGDHRQIQDPGDQHGSIHVYVPQPPSDPNEVDYEDPERPS
ncbi:B-cell receptor CD22-like [Sardina pilchardus]|uniref:B-cell receptor CD22-like n=1 Tax=Sardina pilchardus TaxID=27697 RepID=UPI002E137EFA